MSEEIKVPETSPYIVLKRLRHNGKQKLGARLELTEEEAQPLLALGVIVAAPSQSEPAKDDEQPEGEKQDDPKVDKPPAKAKGGGKNAADEDKAEK